MNMKSLLFSAAALVASTLPSMAQFPEQPITLIVPFAAGGGTDAIARMLASGMEAELGHPVNVVNRTGGAGVIGHAEVVNAAPDGYTIGLATAELATYHWGGLADFNYEDVTPVALINLDAGTFTVSANGPWQTLEQALEDIRSQPEGTFKLASAPGSGYHLAFAGLLNSAGIDPNKVLIVPNQGAAPSFQELASGGVDVVPFSLAEGRAMIDAGIAKPLAVFAPERQPGFPDVPTAEEAVGIAQIGGTWRAIIAPKGLPSDVLESLESAIKTTWDSAQFQEFMNAQSYGLSWADSEGTGTFLAQQDAQSGQAMKDLGLSTLD